MGETTSQLRKTRELRSEIRDVFSAQFAPLALRGLERMLLPRSGVFCDRAIADGNGGLALVGISYRYSAMVAIGLAAWQSLGRDARFSISQIFDRLVPWAIGDARPAGTALVLWALCLAEDPRAADVARSISLRERNILSEEVNSGTMELGWILKAIAEGIRIGIGGLEQLAHSVCHKLVARQDPHSGLFSLGGRQGHRNPLARWSAIHLGSFASQVYPTIGLAAYSSACSSDQALAAAMRCANRIRDLQGPAGQWWWIYHVAAATPAVRYPVYSVHQDAMGPMALLEVERAAKTHGTYSEAIMQSVNWINDHPELPDSALIDSECGVVWRAIQRDPRTTTGAFGLGAAERFRMHLRGWIGSSDRREFWRGHVCRECRPYHLGWILLAASMAAQASAMR